MIFKDMGELMRRWLRGDVSSKDMGRSVLEYLDSPDWRRRKAVIAAEELRGWKSGRERLWELLDLARKDGFAVETEFMPLKDGHDSVIVMVEGGGTGFPSFMAREFVEDAFEDVMRGARRRRAERESRSGRHGGPGQDAVRPRPGEEERSGA